mmetsp:Transcript_6633/g.14485  ORF Transcript_6633/g.14485 Transcript_6633/m.14485 type:complete len:284 (-) Transcript_6633:3228-4079(-)|eukprot:6189092-Pleurochrysis_carterae.AAC.8
MAKAASGPDSLALPLLVSHLAFSAAVLSGTHRLDADGLRIAPGRKRVAQLGQLLALNAQLREDVARLRRRLSIHVDVCLHVFEKVRQPLSDQALAPPAALGQNVSEGVNLLLDELVECGGRQYRLPLAPDQGEAAADELPQVRSGFAAAAFTQNALMYRRRALFFGELTQLLVTGIEEAVAQFHVVLDQPRAEVLDEFSDGFAVAGTIAVTVADRQHLLAGVLLQLHHTLHRLSHQHAQLVHQRLAVERAIVAKGNRHEMEIGQRALTRRVQYPTPSKFPTSL